MVKYMLVTVLSMVLVSLGSASFGKEYEVSSPDKDLRVKVDVKEKIYYSVLYKSKQLLDFR